MFWELEFGIKAAGLGFCVCAQVLVHATAHGGCTDTVSESALVLDSGEKYFAAPGTQTRVNITPGFSIGRSTN